jgi:hypothetical protein
LSQRQFRCLRMSSHRDDARWSADSSARMRFIGSSAVTRLFARTRTGRSSTRRRRRANPTVSEALARYLRGLRYRNRLISTSSAVRYSAPYWSEVKVDWVALRKPPRASAVVRRGKAGPGRAGRVGALTSGRKAKETPRLRDQWQQDHRRDAVAEKTRTPRTTSPFGASGSSDR